MCGCMRRVELRRSRRRCLCVGVGTSEPRKWGYVRIGVERCSCLGDEEKGKVEVGPIWV